MCRGLGRPFDVDILHVSSVHALGAFGSSVFFFHFTVPCTGFDAVTLRSMQTNLERDCGRFSRLRKHFGAFFAPALRRTPVMCGLQWCPELAQDLARKLSQDLAKVYETDTVNLAHLLSTAAMCLR